MENFELRPSGLWVPTDYTQPKSYLNWTEQQQLQQQLIARQNAIISKTSDGLFDVKLGKGEPNYRCYTRAQAESMANRLLGIQNPTNSVFSSASSTPIAKPITQTPISNIYPHWERDVYSRMLESNPLPTIPTQVISQTPVATPEPTLKKPYIKPTVAPASDAAKSALMQQAAAVQPQVISQTPVATPEPTLKKPYVKPAIEPASDFTKQYLELESSTPVDIQPEATTPKATLKKPYVKPTVTPASDLTKQYLELESLTHTDTQLEEQVANSSQRVKTPEQRAEQLRRIRSNPKARAKYNNMKLKNNPELASRYESFCQSAKKAGKMKGLKKAGKWGALAALAIGAIGLTVKACSGDKKDETVKPETPKDNKATNPTTPPASTAEPAPATETPVAPVNDTDEPAEIGIGEFKDGKYKVKKGDSFWKIAEQNLINEYKKAQEAKGETVDETYKPSDAEILKETERLVEKNEYQFDEKHWNTTKPIYEGDILNIAA